MNYQIVKAKTEAGTIFMVQDQTGRVVGQRSTKSRAYVAVLVQETPAHSRVLHQAWFTRESLNLFNIGKGAQGRLLNKGGVKLAALATNVI